MATGDTDDLIRRMHAVLPASWFPAAIEDAPKLRAALAMPAALGVWMYAFVGYVRAQTRISTATGGWLDLAAFDHFGSRLRRQPGQSDAALRTRIQAEILRARATRPALRDLLTGLTGREPRIIEPARPQDVGGWSVPRSGYGVAGAWGSLQMPGEVLVDVYRDSRVASNGAPGWRAPNAGWGKPSTVWLSQEAAADAISDDEIRDAILANKPEGVTVWVKFSN